MNQNHPRNLMKLITNIYATSICSLENFIIVLDEEIIVYHIANLELLKPKPKNKIDLWLKNYYLEKKVFLN